MNVLSSFTHQNPRLYIQNTNLNNLNETLGFCTLFESLSSQNLEDPKMSQRHFKMHPCESQSLFQN